MSERVRLTKHAKQRAAEMGLARYEIAAAARYPDHCYPDRSGSGSEIRVRGRLAVIISTADPELVVTILWNGKESRYETAAEHRG